MFNVYFPQKVTLPVFNDFRLILKTLRSYTHGCCAKCTIVDRFFFPKTTCSKGDSIDKKTKRKIFKRKKIIFIVGHIFNLFSIVMKKKFPVTLFVIIVSFFFNKIIVLRSYTIIYIYILYAYIAYTALLDMFNNKIKKLLTEM